MTCSRVDSFPSVAPPPPCDELIKVLCCFVAAELEVEEGWLDSGELVNSQFSGHTAMFAIECVLSRWCN